MKTQQLKGYGMIAPIWREHDETRLKGYFIEGMQGVGIQVLSIDEKSIRLIKSTKTIKTPTVFGEEQDNAWTDLLENLQKIGTFDIYSVDGGGEWVYDTSRFDEDAIGAIVEALDQW